MSGQHAPGAACDACEGFCIQPVELREFGVNMFVHIGQRVRHRDYDGKRITGRVNGISIDSDRTLQVHIVLDAPIVIRARSADDRDLSIWHQHVPAHELTPFDDRDELLAALLAALREAEQFIAGFEGDDLQEGVDALLAKTRATIANAAGSAT